MIVGVVIRGRKHSWPFTPRIGVVNTVHECASSSQRIHVLQGRECIIQCNRESCKRERARVMQERGRERARVCERVYVREQKVLLGRAEQRHVIIARCECLVMLPILRLCEGERVCIVVDSSDGEQGMLDMLGRVLRSDDTHPSAKNTTAKKKVPT